MEEYKPHGYQRYVTDKMIELPYMGAWLDMGLGKTVCTTCRIFGCPSCWGLQSRGSPR